jgi:hypothetical protein
MHTLVLIAQLVAVEADKPNVVLWRDAGIGWAEVCTAPCRARIPDHGVYVVNGPGIRRSPQFELLAAPGTERHVTVKSTSFTPWMGAILAQYLGWTTLSGGIVMMSMCKFVYDHDGGDPLATFGIVNGFFSIVTGTIAIAWSFWTLTHHKPTQVQIQ